MPKDNKEKRYKQDLEELKMSLGFGRITKEEYEKKVKELNKKHKEDNND